MSFRHSFCLHATNHEIRGLAYIHVNFRFSVQAKWKLKGFSTTLLSVKYYEMSHNTKSKVGLGLKRFKEK